MRPSQQAALLPVFPSSQARALMSLIGNSVSVTSYPFNARGDNSTDDTNAIQGAINAVSASGGGVVHIPANIYRYSTLTLPSGVTLKGEGAKATVLRCTSTTGNGITFNDLDGSNISHAQILSLKLDCVTSSSGIAITGPADPLYVADIVIDDYEIEGFLRGIYIPYGLQVYIGFGRGIGQGVAVAGGVGVQLGDSTLGTPRLVNTAIVQQPYISTYHTSFISDGSMHLYQGVISENSTRAILAGCRLHVAGSWIQATTTLLQTRAGGWPIEFDGACYFLNGSSVEVDDPATMCTLGSAGDLSVFSRSQWKGDATFKYRFAESLARALQIGDASPAYLYNSGGSIRAAAATRPLEVDRNQSGACTLFGLRQQNANKGFIGVNSSGDPVLLGSGGSNIAFTWDNSGNGSVGAGVLGTSSTDGFLYVPTCAGIPTGTPTTKSGYAPIVVNTTNNKLYFYSNGAWRDAGP